MLITYTSAVPVSQKTCCVSIIKTNRLRLFREIKAVTGDILTCGAYNYH